MKKDISAIIGFAAGALIGSAAAFCFIRKRIQKKYEAIYNREIEDAKSYYKDMAELCENKLKEDASEEKASNEHADISYNSIIKESEYHDYSVVDETPQAKNAFYEISAAEFREIPEYDSVSFTHYLIDDKYAYDDGDYVDEIDMMIDELGYTPGEETVYLRNDFIQRDYEIIPANCLYDDSIDTTPRPV